MHNLIQICSLIMLHRDVAHYDAKETAQKEGKLTQIYCILLKTHCEFTKHSRQRHKPHTDIYVDFMAGMNFNYDHSSIHRLLINILFHFFGT